MLHRNPGVCKLETTSSGFAPGRATTLVDANRGLHFLQVRPLGLLDTSVRHAPTLSHTRLLLVDAGRRQRARSEHL
jgi:hypothetical protein